MNNLKNHIETINAEIQARMDADPDLQCTFWACDDQTIAELIADGITTGDEWDRMQLGNSISDCSKAAVGCRIGVDWTEHTKAELEEILDGWVRMANEQYEAECEWEKREEEERENLASQCHVSVDQIVEWESQYDDCYRSAIVDRDFIESRPVEPYEEYHSIELGMAA